MSAGRWRPTMVWCLALWLAALTGPGHADSLAWQEYSQRIKAWQTITPLGDAPFGEHMSLYTGELSFYQADISLKGRGPDLVIGRSFSPKIRNSWPSATYDSDGHRIRKTLASGPSTDFIYSQDGQLLATREAGSDQWTDYIHLGSSLLARWTAGTATWLLTDRLGSPIAEAGAQGLLSQRNDYRPWGEPLTPDSQTRPGFTGHVRDPETGLNYALARYYRPAIGQFDSVDPKRPEAGDLFGFNRYAYAANNPVLNTDPDGQQTLPAAVYQIDWSKPENRQAAAEVAGLYTSFVPVIGDIQNIADAYREPTALNIAAAGVGLIPEVGGAASKTLKEGKIGLGLFSGNSIPARSSARDFTPLERAKINTIGAETGCHSCGSKQLGTKSGNFIPDHQPPSSVTSRDTPQRLYPHCLQCSRQQGLEIARKLREKNNEVYFNICDPCSLVDPRGRYPRWESAKQSLLHGGIDRLMCCRGLQARN